jgi:hypothetical protein
MARFESPTALRWRLLLVDEYEVLSVAMMPVIGVSIQVHTGGLSNFLGRVRAAFSQKRKFQQVVTGSSGQVSTVRHELSYKP